MNDDPHDMRAHLSEVADLAQRRFTETHGARERALRLSREMVRGSANSIRASHRGDFDRARELLDQVAVAAREVAGLRESQPAVYYAGYVEDAHKEYVEASVVLAIVRGDRAAWALTSSESAPRPTSTVSAMSRASCGGTSSTPCAAATSAAARSCSA